MGSGERHLEGRDGVRLGLWEGGSEEMRWGLGVVAEAGSWGALHLWMERRDDEW